jgi:hypothetical protein
MDWTMRLAGLSRSRLKPALRPPACFGLPGRNWKKNLFYIKYLSYFYRGSATSLQGEQNLKKKPWIAPFERTLSLHAGCRLIMGGMA